MPLVIDPDNSQCDVCLETYDAQTSVTPVVLACGHALCRPCSQSIGASCHLCRSWFNRDRIIKLHVDYGPEKRLADSTVDLVKEMETRATQLAGLHDVGLVKAEAKVVTEWLEGQDENKHMLLRSHCELILKLCLTMESKIHYKERYRQTDNKLRDHIQESSAKIQELQELVRELTSSQTAAYHSNLQQVRLERELQDYKEDDLDLISTRSANPLPAPPQPVEFYFSPQSPPLREPAERLSKSNSTGSSKHWVRDSDRGKSSRSPSRHRSRRMFGRSGSSSVQRSDNEGAQNPIPFGRGSLDLQRTGSSDTDSQRPDFRGHRTMGSSSRSHDDVTNHFTSKPPKSRSYSHGQGDVSPANVASGSRSSQYGAYPSSRDLHSDSVEYTADDPFLSMAPRPRKTSATSNNSVHGRTGSQSYRYPPNSSGNHQHERVSHSRDSMTDSTSRARRASMSHNPSSSAPSASYGSMRNQPTVQATNAQPGPSGGSIPFPQPSITPQSTTPWSVASKRLPTTPTSTINAMSDREPQQVHGQSQAPPAQRKTSHSRASSHGQVDPQTVPQERIHVRALSQSRPPIPPTLTGSSVAPYPSGRQQDTVVYPRRSIDGQSDRYREAYASDSAAVREPRLRRTSGTRAFGA